MACILVVDHDADTREALREVLEDEGFEVRVSPGARAAIAEITRSEGPAVVLLDASMPGMSGAELLDWMEARKELDRIPVVLVSGDTTCAGHRRAAAVLHKPYDLEALLQLAHQFCAAQPLPPADRPPQKS